MASEAIQRRIGGDRGVVVTLPGIFDSFFKDTSSLAVKQGAYGFLLELISTSGLYLAFAWVALAAVRQQISLGDMTMYLLIFQEGQQAFSSILRAIGGR